MLALVRRLVIVAMFVRDFPDDAHGRHGLRTASSRVEPRVRRVEGRSPSSSARRRRTPPTRAMTVAMTITMAKSRQIAPRAMQISLRRCPAMALTRRAGRAAEVQSRKGSRRRVRERRQREARRRGTPLVTPVVKHEESGRSRIGDRPLSRKRAPLTRP